MKVGWQYADCNNKKVAIFCFAVHMFISLCILYIHYTPYYPLCDEYCMFDDNMISALSVKIILVVDFFNRINVIYGVVCEFCNEQTCPTMSGGPK